MKFEVDLTKLGMIVCLILLVIAFGYAAYEKGINDSKVSSVDISTVPTVVQQTPQPTVGPTPVPSIAVVTEPTLEQTATVYAVSDVGSQGGYICMVDKYGNEYLVINFDQGTPELLGASYTGAVDGSYNGIPMLENVALIGYPESAMPSVHYEYYWDNQYWYDDGYTASHVTHDMTDIVVTKQPPHLNNIRDARSNIHTK